MRFKLFPMPVTDTRRDPYTIVEEAEEKKESWLQRNFGRETIINETFHYANENPATPDINGNVVLKRSNLVRLLLIIIPLLFAVSFYKIWFNFPLDVFFPGWLIFGALWLVITVIGIAQYTSKHNTFDITVNKAGIEMGPRHFFWKDIRATFLVDRPQGRNRARVLVFVMQDDTLQYIEMTYFPKWAKNFKTLCTAIRDFHQPA